MCNNVILIQITTGCWENCGIYLAVLFYVSAAATAGDFTGCGFRPAASPFATASPQTVAPDILLPHQFGQHNIPTLGGCTSFYSLYNRLFALASRQIASRNAVADCHRTLPADFVHPATAASPDSANCISVCDDLKPGNEASPTPSPPGDSDSYNARRLASNRFHPYYLLPTAATGRTRLAADQI